MNATHATATRQFTTVIQYRNGSHNVYIQSRRCDRLHIIKETHIIYTIPAAAANLGSDCSVFVIFLITLKVVFL